MALPSLVVPTQIDLPPLSPPLVALTFDDGPHPAATRRLRDILRDHQVPATFFVVGKVAARHPKVVKNLAREGHEIAGHSWSHPDIQRVSARRMKRELDKTRRLIHRLTGVDTWLFRTPGSTLSYIRKWFRIPRGYTLVLWDVHSRDHEGLSADAMVDRIMGQVSDGDIVLLHNGYRSTAEAVESLIPLLKKRGYQFVTISTLLQHSARDKWASSSSVLYGG